MLGEKQSQRQIQKTRKSNTQFWNYFCDLFVTLWTKNGVNADSLKIVYNYLNNICGFVPIALIYTWQRYRVLEFLLHYRCFFVYVFCDTVFIDVSRQCKTPLIFHFLSTLQITRVSPRFDLKLPRNNMRGRIKHNWPLSIFTHQHGLSHVPCVHSKQ